MIASDKRAEWRERIQQAKREHDRAGQNLVATVGQARMAGASWMDIGDFFGVTRQAAWERFGKARGEEPPRDDFTN